MGPAAHLRPPRTECVASSARPLYDPGNHRSFCAIIPFSSRPWQGGARPTPPETRTAAAKRMVEESIGGAGAANWAQFL